MYRPSHVPAAVLVLAATLAACQPDVLSVDLSTPAASASTARTLTRVRRIYGAPVRVGNGRARTYVLLDPRNGNPLELGVALDDRALDGLPAAMPMPGNSGDAAHSSMSVFLLAMPAVHRTPYQFVQFDWNPAGHEPAGVYDVPHFDFHFHTISNSERESIIRIDTQFATKANSLPAGAFVPPSYVPLAPPNGTPADLAVPQMGVHWVDTRSPALQNVFGNPAGYRPFTTTFLFGSWNGRFIFLEPMITRAYILAKKTATHAAQRNEVIPVPSPAQLRVPGFYPASYRIAWDETSHEYHIALTDLTRRN